MNISTIFSEICFWILSWMTFAFSEVKVDQSSTNVTDFENTFGNIFLYILYFSIWVNLVYLVPTKIYEFYLIIKKIIWWCKNKEKTKEKIRNEVNNLQNNVNPPPQLSTPQIEDNQCFIEFAPKRKQWYLERERMNEQEKHKIDFYNWEFLKKYEVHKENKNTRSKRKIITFILK